MQRFCWSCKVAYFFRLFRDKLRSFIFLVTTISFMAFRIRPESSLLRLLTPLSLVYELGKLGGGAALGYYFSGVRVELEGLMSSTVFWKKL